MKKFFSKIEKGLFVTEKTLLCVCLTVMLTVAALQVFLRNVFDTGISWAEVFTRHMVLFLLFFGASLATRRKTHLQMDLSHKLMPACVKPVFEVFIFIICIAVNSLLCKAAWVFMMGERESGSVLFYQIPTWCFIVIMPIGFGLISLRFVINFIQTIHDLILRRKPLPPEFSIPEVAILCSKEDDDS